MQTRTRWACAFGIALAGAMIASGCLMGANVLLDRSVALLKSAYDEYDNPLVPTEAEWKAMSWEEKSKCKQQFWEDFKRRLQQSNALDFIAMLGWCGAVFSACTSIFISVLLFKWRLPCDSAARQNAQWAAKRAGIEGGD